MSATIGEVQKLGEALYEELEQRDLTEDEKSMVLAFAANQIDQEECSIGVFDE